MILTSVLKAAAALALATAPTIAKSQSVPAPVPAPALETVDGEDLRGGFVIPLIALVAIILGVCAATSGCGIFGDDDDDLPSSP